MTPFCQNCGRPTRITEKGYRCAWCYRIRYVFVLVWLGFVCYALGEYGVLGP